jgi:cytochrome c
MSDRCLFVGLILLVCCLSRAAYGANVSDAERSLARQSAERCVATAKTPPAVSEIMSKVKKAVDLLNEEGAEAFPKFKGNQSEFIFSGTYVWIHALDGTSLMHPIKPELVGTNILNLRDKDGKMFIKEMNHVADNEHGAWVAYNWPKPGSDDDSIKVSYVRSATVDGKPVVVGCGVYDLTMEQVKKALKAASCK